MNKYLSNNANSIYHSSIIIVLILVNYIWFKDFSKLVFSMDDPWVIDSFSDTTKSFFEQTFLNTGANRFRPIFSFFQYIELELFGKSYSNIVFFNIFFNGLIIITLYSIILNVTKSKFLPFLVTLLYLTSRFSYYNITEFNGILESLSIFFLLMMIIFSIKFWMYRNKSYYYAVLLFYFCIIFTHERYIVLAGFIIFMLFMVNFLSIKQKIIYSFFPIIILIFNITIKKFVLALPFLVGTGSSHEMGFQFKQSLIHYFQSLFNILGYSNGPLYLNGYTIEVMTKSEQICTGIILLLTVIIFLRFLYTNIICKKENRINEIKIFLLFLSAILLIILSFSLTIRVEQRWLYAPYVLYIIYFTYIVNKQKSKYILGLFLGFIALNIYMNNIYKKYTNNIFFIGAKIESKIILDLTVGKYGKLLEEKEIFVVDSNSSFTNSLKQLILSNSEIKSLNISTVSSPYMIKDIKSNTLIFVINNGILTEISTIFPKNFKDTKILSGTHYLDGGGWITKEITAMMNSGNGKLKGSIFVDNNIRLPNKMHIYINEEEKFLIDIVNLGSTSFEFNCIPNQNILVKILLDKAIIPAKLGLGGDLRELSVILEDFKFD